MKSKRGTTRSKCRAIAAQKIRDQKARINVARFIQEEIDRKDALIEENPWLRDFAMRFFNPQFRGDENFNIQDYYPDAN